jgi:serine/threonine protein phosphatase PrpC
MLGDRYLKEQDVGFTAEPYVSEGLRLGPQDEALLVLASDGLWDVVAHERVAALAAKAAAAAAAAAGGSSVLGQGIQAHAAAAAAAPAAVAEVNVQQPHAAAAGDAGSALADGKQQQPQQQQGAAGNQPRRNVAAAVADELMQAALRLHSKDDISILVLHVLPAAVAGLKQQAAPAASSSGSM